MKPLGKSFAALIIAQSSSMLRCPSACIISEKRCGPSVDMKPTRIRASDESRKKATAGRPLIAKLPIPRSQRYSRPSTSREIGVGGDVIGYVSIVLFLQRHQGFVVNHGSDAEAPQRILERQRRQGRREVGAHGLQGHGD